MNKHPDYDLSNLSRVSTPSSTIRTRDANNLMQTDTLPAPGALTAGTPSSGGSVDAGTHSYKVTYVDIHGVESAGGAKSNVITTASNKTVGLSAIPVSDRVDIAYRKIYRTKAGDTGSYYLLTTLTDNSSTTYSDTTADASLGAVMPSVTQIPEPCSAISVGTAGAYTIYPVNSWTGVVVTLAAGMLHYITTAKALGSPAGTVVYWY
jgi:hypothetical protein